MKKILIPLLICCFLLGGCTSSPTQNEESTEILATTYPLYLFARAITEGADHIHVSQLITEQVSCLHDYTLTVKDMKLIEQADILLLNGADLEAFMDSALEQTKASVIDCSQNIDLLASSGHEHHHDDHEHEHHGHYDPHYWLDLSNAEIILRNITDSLSALDNANKILYENNFSRSASLLAEAKCSLPSLTCPYMITFHDGFQYFAHATGLTLLKSIEEESGSEASAAEIKEIISLIQANNIPAIFIEKNGSDRTANVISRETGVRVFQLDMLMSGDGTGLADYIAAIQHNYSVIQEALS